MQIMNKHRKRLMNSKVWEEQIVVLGPKPFVALVTINSADLSHDKTFCFIENDDVVHCVTDLNHNPKHKCID